MQHFNWELIGLAVTIITAILGGIWFIFNKIFHLGRFSQRFDNMDKRTCNADCDNHSRDIEKMRNNIESVKALFSSHDDDIKAIKGLLLIKHKEAANLFSIKNSPRQLNEIGERVYRDMNGEDFLNKNKDYLFSLINGYNPKTALDVENAAHAICVTSLENEIFNGLKNFVYNSPSYKITDRDGNERMYDLAMSDICFILSLPLRDMYLKAHPEIVSE